MSHIPPSLGTNALAVWRAWRELTEQGGDNARIECLNPGEGVYQWREGKVWRLWRVKRLPVCRELTDAEQDALFDCVRKGFCQVYLPACRGLYGEQVLHQATGREIGVDMLRGL
jgi:hypothetical protein